MKINGAPGSGTLMLDADWLAQIEYWPLIGRRNT